MKIFQLRYRIKLPKIRNEKITVVTVHSYYIIAYNYIFGIIPFGYDHLYKIIPTKFIVPDNILKIRFLSGQDADNFIKKTETKN